MTDNPDVPPPVSSDLAEVSVLGSIQAPFVYFESAPVFGCLNGVVQITLEAMQVYPGLKIPQRQRVAVAHLRMSIPAAINLKAAIDGALLIAAPTETVAKN